MMSEPKSEFGTYYFECCGGKHDGLVCELPDAVIEEGIEIVTTGDFLPSPAYKITDVLLRPNVYKAVYVGIMT